MRDFEIFFYYYLKIIGNIYVNDSIFNTVVFFLLNSYEHMQYILVHYYVKCKNNSFFINQCL